MGGAFFFECFLNNKGFGRRCSILGSSCFEGHTP